MGGCRTLLRSPWRMWMKRSWINSWNWRSVTLPRTRWLLRWAGRGGIWSGRHGSSATIAPPLMAWTGRPVRKPGQPRRWEPRGVDPAQARRCRQRPGSGRDRHLAGQELPVAGYRRRGAAPGPGGGAPSRCAPGYRAHLGGKRRGAEASCRRRRRAHARRRRHGARRRRPLNELAAKAPKRVFLEL